MLGGQVREAATWKSATRACPVCGDSRHVRLGTRGGHSHRDGLGTLATVVRCADCHLVYCRPTLEPVGNPYSAYSAEEYFTGQEREAKLRSGRSLAARAEALLGRKGSILELGCGRGELLEAASGLGWEVHGVEMTPQFADEATARGVRIERARIESSRLLEESEGRFDVVYLAAILEHLYDPVQCLSRVCRALAPGGLVFIDVPNECSVRTKIGNMYMRLRGRNWAVNLSPTFPPFHVVGFCPTSLRRAVVSAGMDVVALDVIRWPASLPERPGFWSSLETSGSRMVNALGRLLGDGDGLHCWGRRPA
jgi:SAM-dependent methyltransferase